jgi:hypothetical protein
VDETDLDEVAALACMGTDIRIYTLDWLSSQWHDAPFVEIEATS